MKDSYDESDFHYDRKIKSPTPKGTNIDCYWRNFYGSYFKIIYNGENYDIKTNCALIYR